MRKVKNILFIIIINLVILLSIEMILKLFGVGTDTSFLTREKRGNEVLLKVNPYYLNQYFPRLNKSIPSPYELTFEKNKPDSVFRIYVIGESTSQGFPYSKLEAFPYQLQQMLNSVVKHKRVEVLNFSIAAINSYVGNKMAKEICKYPPDLMICYYGNNEFIGIGGATSSEHFLFRASMLVSQTKIGQGLKGLISNEKPSKDEGNITLFEQMAEKEQIKYKSDVYFKTIELFERNYQHIIKTCQSRGVPVLLLGMVTNLRDLPPLKSEDILAVQAKAIQDLPDHETDEAVKQELLEIAGENARFHFLLGKKMLSREEYKWAELFFHKAVDYDLLRFRATSDIQQSILNTAKKNRCEYVNLQEVFNANDATGIAGNTLLCEHVHPLIQGHRLIADTLAKFIYHRYLYPGGQELPDFDHIPIMRTMVDQMITINRLDIMFTTKVYKDIGYINLNARLELFDTARINNEIRLRLKQNVDPEAFNYLTTNFGKNLSTDQMHVNFGVWLLQNKRPVSQGYKEFEIAVALNPDNRHAINNMAVVDFRTGNEEEAFNALFELFECNEITNKVIQNNFIYIAQNTGMANKLDELKKKELHSGSRTMIREVKLLSFKQ